MFEYYETKEIDVRDRFEQAIRMKTADLRAKKCFIPIGGIVSKNVSFENSSLSFRPRTTCDFYFSRNINQAR